MSDAERTEAKRRSNTIWARRRLVTHKKKKCSRCRQREIEAARRALESHRGRGRRTDLERVA